MTEPGWVLGLFAVAMVTVSAYCAVRLLIVRPLHRSLHYDVNFAHVAMGVAMAGMLSPGLHSLPNPLWEALFAGLAVWFAGRSGRFVRKHGFGGISSDHVHRISHYLTHLVMACSMLYMYFATSPVPAVASTSGMAMGPAPGTAAYLGIPLAFVVVLCGSAIWHIDSLSRFSRPAMRAVPVGVGARGADPGIGAVDTTPPWLAPRLEMGCHIAMCVAMAFMLVLLL